MNVNAENEISIIEFYNQFYFITQSMFTLTIQIDYMCLKQNHRIEPKYINLFH